MDYVLAKALAGCKHTKGATFHVHVKTLAAAIKKLEPDADLSPAAVVRRISGLGGELFVCPTVQQGGYAWARFMSELGDDTNLEFMAVGNHDRLVADDKPVKREPDEVKSEQVPAVDTETVKKTSRKSR